MTTKQVLLLAGVIVVGCAALVWALERFEVAKLHTEMRDYLSKHDRFDEWLEGRAGNV